MIIGGGAEWNGIAHAVRDGIPVPESAGLRPRYPRNAHARQIKETLYSGRPVGSNAKEPRVDLSRIPRQRGPYKLIERALLRELMVRTSASKKNSHCSYCGYPFPEGLSWPRTCSACGAVSYANPIPVAVVVQPVDHGVLCVRRGIEPRRGMLALPGGFINFGESWQSAAARELLEETGLGVEPTGIRALRVFSAPDSTLLVFGVAPAISASELPPFAPSPEATERVVLTRTEELAFPLHTRVLREYLAGEVQTLQRESKKAFD